MQLIERAVEAMPGSVLDRSGAVFYSAPPAFDGPRDLYILGLNPGGDPVDQRKNTVRAQFENWRGKDTPYSSYVDEEWEKGPAGTYGMQPRLRHMAASLGIDLRLVPSSNVVFVRSRDEARLSAEIGGLLEACWPVHAAVIGELGIRTVLCLGRTAGSWVRRRTGAAEQIAAFTESNARGWTSTAHRSPAGLVVCTLTHPGRADWRNPLADPTPMIRKVTGM